MGNIDSKSCRSAAMTPAFAQIFSNCLFMNRPLHKSCVAQPTPRDAQWAHVLMLIRAGGKPSV
jgi:hypothetical protein